MIRTAASAALAALALAGCNPAPEAEADPRAAEPSSRTLASELESAGGLDRLEALVGVSGLEQVLEGVGPYTVLAPVDDAFSGAPSFEFRDEAQKAQAAALLRAHMLPGAVTRADVATALDRAGGKVEMRTLDGGLIAFSREGENVVATTVDGARAVLLGDQVLASNGVIQPIDGVLLKPPAT